MSFGKSKSKAEEGISQAGATLYERGKMTEPELKEEAGAFSLGDLIKQIGLYQAGLGTAPSGYLDASQQLQRGGGELGSLLYSQITDELKDPYKFYQSTLEPELALTQDTINREYQRRGLIRSGLGIEAMGRAGTELAVRSALARQQARAQALARGGSLLEYGQGVQGQNLANLSNLYGTQRGYSQTARNRQAGVATQAAQYAAYPYQYALGQSGGDFGGLGAGLGMLAGGLLAVPTGGVSIPTGAMIGGSLGGGMGGMVKY